MSKPKNPGDLPEQQPDTRLVTGGRDARFSHGFVNTPALRGSTVHGITSLEHPRYPAPRRVWHRLPENSGN
jgi:hypothetical protein